MICLLFDNKMNVVSALLDTASLVYRHIPLSSQIAVAHSVIKLSIFAGQQSYSFYRWIKNDSDKQPNCLIVEVKEDSDADFVVLSTFKCS